jgi:hypothetical protein
MNEHDATELAFKNGYKQGAADAVRKIQEKLKSMKYISNTKRKTIRKEEVLEQINWILHEVIPKKIDEVAEKMMEENQ